MNHFGDTGRITEGTEVRQPEKNEIRLETLEKYDRIMEDDRLGLVPPESEEKLQEADPKVIEEKYGRLLEEESCEEENEIPGEEMFLSRDISEIREPGTEYRIGENIYETDDTGRTYKENGKVLPETEYTINGNTYRTDACGRKVSCDAGLKYTEDGVRNIKEQRESGGSERLEGDDGGHIVARILGGSEGLENLVAMRGTVNRGDYKRMENEMSKALLEGKDVKAHFGLRYEEDSERPSTIRAEYTIDGKKTVCRFDNKENSTELVGSLEGKISDENCSRLKQMIDDMKEDGVDASITSVKEEYDENGNPAKVTVGILNEQDGTKSYREFDPR
jgi:hypothetical protein